MDGSEQQKGSGDGALEGIRVIECGTLIAGPFCGQLLGDFGAEIIKLEDPHGGDQMRGWGQAKIGGLSLHWPMIGRNKKSVTADLRRREGQELLRGLAAEADVLVENFRPGTMERWGLGPGRVMAVNPRLIVVRISGYGQDGPYASRAGFGSIGEAIGGIRYITGEPDRPPSRMGISIGDSLAAIFAAFGTLLALRARDRTGRGQVVDTAIYEAVLAVTEALIAEFALAGHQRQRTGAVLPGAAPSNVYTAADGEDVLVAANRNTVFGRLAIAMGRPELADDPRYATDEARGTHQADLDNIIARWVATLKTAELLDQLNEAAVPASRIYSAADMLADPHFKAREAIAHPVHPTLGDFPMPNVVPRLSETPGAVRSVGPGLGAHNNEVYGSILGMTAMEIANLRTAGVI